MAKNKYDIKVNNLFLFEKYLILFHEPTRGLYAFPIQEHDSILKKNKVSSLSAISESEIKCYPLTSDRMNVEDYTVAVPVSGIREVGYFRHSSNPDLVQFLLYE